MSRPSDADDLDSQRHELDAAETSARAAADAAKVAERERLDRTRQNGRGDRQAREGLDRQRASEDEVLAVERKRTDDTRRFERRLGDAAVAREKELRESSDDLHAEGSDRAARRLAALRESLRLVESQLVVVDGTFAQLLDDTPRDAFAARVRDGVALVGVTAARLRELLELAIEPDDARNGPRDVGGCG